MTSFWIVRGACAWRNTGDINRLTMDIELKYLVLYNPNDDTSLRIGVVKGQRFSADLGASGPGGRDTGTALAAGEAPWLYLIGGAGMPVKGMWSRTGPYDTNGATQIGPLLSGGYTHYAPISPHVVSDADNLVFDSRQRDEVTLSDFPGYISGNNLHVVGPVTGKEPIAVGKRVRGAGVVANTIIESGSGTDWIVTKSQTIGSASAPVSMRATTPKPSSPYVVGDMVWFTTTIIDPIDILSGSYTYWDYRQWVHPDFILFNLELDAEAASQDQADMVQGALVAAWAGVDTGSLPNAGNDVNLSVYAYGYNQTAAQNMGLDVPMTGFGKIALSWIMGGKHTKVFVPFARYYRFER